MIGISRLHAGQVTPISPLNGRCLQGACNLLHSPVTELPSVEPDSKIASQYRHDSVSTRHLSVEFLLNGPKY